MDKIKSEKTIITLAKHEKEVPTLLEEYVLLKSSAYIEPNRMGTPKGEPIGFSKAKYETSLRFLHMNKLKNIAKASNISYGVLRRWAIDESFQQAVRNTQEDFAEHFVYILRRKLEEWYQEEKAYNEKPLRKMMSTRSPDNDCDIFADFQFYSVSLREIIVDKLILLFSQTHMSDYALTFAHFMEALIYFHTYAGKRRNDLKQTFEKISWKIKALSILSIAKELKAISLSTEGSLTKKNRKYIFYAADILHQHIMDPNTGIGPLMDLQTKMIPLLNPMKKSSLGDKKR